jgi:hypothetical protein
MDDQVKYSLHLRFAVEPSHKSRKFRYDYSRFTSEQADKLCLRDGRLSKLTAINGEQRETTNKQKQTKPLALQP